MLFASLYSLSNYAQENPSILQIEKDAILYMREEEKLARDVYNILYEKWEVNPFGNIRQSEQHHMDRVKELITKYKLEDPVEKNSDKRGVFSNTVFTNYYTDLVASGNKSLADALKAGAKIEELDIADLEKRIQQTQNEEIIATYKYLKMASGNHLRAFTRNLQRQGIEYKPEILSKEQYDAIINSENSHDGHEGTKPGKENGGGNGKGCGNGNGCGNGKGCGKNCKH
ncbi:MAG: DUF2202 domain-containing protein [Chitinophagaceae bacterium]|nr:DUF2202 domain-containing protein [Chitinophagaceae bacterium]MBK8951384.1 DUF2202 domain-containing protein [Chitinophagaceae bacterium]